MIILLAFIFSFQTKNFKSTYPIYWQRDPLLAFSWLLVNSIFIFCILIYPENGNNPAKLGWLIESKDAWTIPSEVLKELSVTFSLLNALWQYGWC